MENWFKDSSFLNIALVIWAKKFNIISGSLFFFGLYKTNTNNYMTIWQYLKPLGKNQKTKVTLLPVSFKSEVPLYF